MTTALSPEAVRAFCCQREVDLVLARAPGDRAISLHAEFDGHGDFFTVVARDVEYVDLPGGFTLGELRFAAAPSDLASISKKWTGLEERYSGTCLAFRAAGSADWASADSRDLHLLVANNISVCAGTDWKDST